MSKSKSTSVKHGAEDIYFAFASGTIDYACDSCGRCCQGYGIGEDHKRLAPGFPVHQLSAFVDIGSHRKDTNTGTGAAMQAQGTDVTALFTYSDGCSHQGDKLLCEIHASQGAAAKPRICRLFPFSKIIDVDGLWTLMPHHRCPWTHSEAGNSELSKHEDIRGELEQSFIDQMQPNKHPVITLMPAAQREVLEQSICDVVADATDLSAAIQAQRAKQAELGYGATVAPDRDLWLDLLRSAGEPKPLSAQSAATFKAALPALRIELLSLVPLEDIPSACEALLLYLQTLAELSGGESESKTLTGENILAHLEFAQPWIWLLSQSHRALPDLPEEPAHPALEMIWIDLLDGAHLPMGEAFLAATRNMKGGALSTLRNLAMWGQYLAN